MIPVNDNEDVMCVYYDDNGLGAALLINQGDGNYSKVTEYYGDYPFMTDDYNKGYYIKSGSNDLKICFNFTENKSSIPTDAFATTEFEYKGKTIYFYIFDIETTHTIGCSSGIITN